MSTWLENLKAGDSVVIFPGIGTPPRLYTVDRLTPTQIVIGTWKFRRDNGWMKGEKGWSRLSLHEATPELLQRIHRETLQEYITTHPKRLLGCSVELLEQVVTVMKASDQMERT